MSSSKTFVRQLRAGRSLLGWSLEEMAAVSGVSVPMIEKMEAGHDESRGASGAFTKIVRALQTAGIEFLQRDGIGVRLRPAVFEPIDAAGPATDMLLQMDAAIADDRARRNDKGPRT